MATQPAWEFSGWQGEPPDGKEIPGLALQVNVTRMKTAILLKMARTVVSSMFWAACLYTPSVRSRTGAAIIFPWFRLNPRIWL